MLGRTHFRIGVLSYAIASTIPFVSDKVIHTQNEVSLLGLAVAGIGALMVDADSHHSRINHMNPATGIMDKGIEATERILKMLARLVFTIGLGIIILIYSKQIIQEVSVLPQLSTYAYVITYGTVFLLFLAALLDERTLKHLPVIGLLYKDTSIVIDKTASILKRVWMLVVYLGAGAGIIIYNIMHSGNIAMYCIGILFIAIAVFPHRSFLHSIEGLVVFSIAVSYIAGRFDMKYLASAFIIGYASHIYWADILTKEGVPLLSSPRFIAKAFEKLGVHNKFERVLHKAGEFRLRIPLMSTGTKFGNLFEAVYTIVLMIIAVALFIVHGGTIRM